MNDLVAPIPPEPSLWSRVNDGAVVLGFKLGIGIALAQILVGGVIALIWAFLASSHHPAP